MFVRCVVACYTSVERRPVFLPLTLDVSWEQFDNGEHFDMARQKAFELGYDDPLTVYDEGDNCWYVFKFLFQDQMVGC